MNGEFMVIIGDGKKCKKKVLICTGDPNWSKLNWPFQKKRSGSENVVNHAQIIHVWYIYLQNWVIYGVSM